MSYLRKAYKDSITFGLGNIISRFIIVLLLPFYTRVLSIQDFGIFSLLLIYFNVVSIIARFGVANIMLKYYIEEKDREEQKRVAGSALTYLSAINAIIFVLVVLFSKSISSLILRDDYSFLIILFTMNAFFEAIEGNFVSIMTAESRWKAYAFAAISYAVSLVLFSVVSIYGFKSGIGGLSWSLLLAKAIMFTISYIAVRDCINLKPKIIYIRKYFDLGKHLIVSNLCFWVINMSDKIMLNYFRGVEDVAVLSVANRIASIIQLFIYIPFTMVWNQLSIRIYREKDSSKIYGEIFTHLIMVLAAVTLAITIFSKEIVVILTTPAYLKAWLPSAIAALSMSLFTLYYYFTFYSTVVEKTDFISKISIAGMLLNLTLNLIMVYFLGIMGAAFTGLVTYAFMFIFIFIYADKALKMKFDIRKIALILMLSSILSVSSIISVHFWWIKALIYIVYATIAYRFFGNFRKFKSLILENVKRFI
ncbi:MAG: oligosaccharide flippase family protein [bacterium]|nr:oligosaccharide flippase family protein [bacterium]